MRIWPLESDTARKHPRQKNSPEARKNHSRSSFQAALKNRLCQMLIDSPQKAGPESGPRKRAQKADPESGARKRGQKAGLEVCEFFFAILNRGRLVDQVQAKFFDLVVAQLEVAEAADHFQHFAASWEHAT